MRTLTLWILTTLLVGRAAAQFDATYPEPIEQPRGALVLHGGGSVSREIRSQFVDLAGGKKAKLIVIPTADYDDAVADRQIEIWSEFEPENVTVLHAASRDETMHEDFAKPLSDATGVWITGGKQSRLAETYVGTPVEKAVIAVVRRGGVVGGSSAGAAISSKVMIVRGEERQGFDLIPGAIVDQHFAQREREPRLLNILKSHPERVGFGIDENTALVLRGRRLTVAGEGNVTVLIQPGTNRPLRKELLGPGKQADLVALSRAAIARRQPEFPTRTPPTPNVASGALVIVGGGGNPPGLLDRFVKLAGGAGAPIVYVPCEEAERIPPPTKFLEQLKKAGATNVTWIHTKDRRRANQDETILEPLRKAKGIWFGGGRQWNLVDSYQNTTAHQLMHDVLARGGVIGGSSAGASIQGDYMPRGDPLGNLNIIAEGYERGLGFLTGVAIDQHFTQRKRDPDMRMLIKTYPQLLGVGIDESTALVVTKHIAEVVGAGNVFFFDHPQGGGNDDNDGDAETKVVAVRAGSRFDLEKRTLIPAE